MATRKKQASGPPAGYKKLEGVQPDGTLEIEVGESVQGVLVGPPHLSKKNPERGHKFRAIKTEEGTFWIGGTKLNQLGVMELPAGTPVWLERKKDVRIAGNPQPMKDYDVSIPETAEAAADTAGDGLPF